ncbi:hypothetical protein KIPB_008937 [Kipferlia bialata]|uniref:Uncharacterized protein n=1 Tax=Kipferlia bialata TaxID=797122 RepID=A0A391NR94_9EUKA|nr:hypothetical protein KIPB_008937 [Kipferlia bialata]|eukprot:g8937.t1
MFKVKRRRGDAWPQPMFFYETGIVRGKMVVLRGYQELVVNVDETQDMLRPNTAMWVFDLHREKGTATISLSGHIEWGDVLFMRNGKRRRGHVLCALDIGPYICLFRTDGVYMYDRVSEGVTLYEALPYPDQVLSASMLNPTTMLVVQRERMLVVELDPSLFQRFSDAD